MADVDPVRKRLAQLLRMLGTKDNERKNAFVTLERFMQSAGLNWSDIGNFVEGKLSETEMREFAQAMRAEGVEDGIKIGMARAGNGHANGQFARLNSLEMAEYCHDRLSQLKDANQRDFVGDMLRLTQRGACLSSARYSYLVGIYIKVSGTTG